MRRKHIGRAALYKIYVQTSKLRVDYNVSSFVPEGGIADPFIAIESKQRGPPRRICDYVFFRYTFRFHNAHSSKVNARRGSDLGIMSRNRQLRAP